MKKFSSMHVRALCHATEDMEKVTQAVRLLTPDAELEVTKAQGHHGNSIEVVEAKVRDEPVMLALFDRLAKEDLEELRKTVDQRVDESCNFFLRVDKQSAYTGSIRISTAEDTIAVRLKVTAFPARREAALAIVRGHLQNLEGGPRDTPG